MKVPSLKWTPTHSPSAGQSAVVALVSGPRTVREVRPASRVTTITQLHAAIDRKVPARFAVAPPDPFDDGASRTAGLRT